MATPASSVDSIAPDVLERLRAHRLFVVVLDVLPRVLREYLRRAWKKKYAVEFTPMFSRAWMLGEAAAVSTRTCYWQCCVPLRGSG